MVSVIIVVRNAEKNIIACIDSVLNQFKEGEQWELIIVDGLSVDKTRKIVIDYLKQKNILYRIENNPQKTLASGWNKAIRLAQGEYIVRPDAHAELLEGYIKVGVEYLRKNDAIAAVGGTLITKANSVIGRMIAIVLSNPMGVGRSLFRIGVTKDTYTSTAVYAVYRKSIFNIVGGFNEKLNRNQDIELHQRIVKAGYKFLTSARMKAIYHSRTTFYKFLQQGFWNGYWIIKSNSFHINHLIPLIFVLSLIMSYLIAPFLFYAILLFHLVLGFIAFIWKSKVYSPLELIILESLAISLHLMYGVGSLYGLIRLPF
ncbi:MAG: glycosyltransferase family 2 protein [Bacteroides clarus]|uniref:Glycosyltransferase family 2 protein n=1 Tax=Bacteroides clarus TaxID=626929 RepID=A0A412XZ70_9BACE|nr:glycosyltransferase family 2 protein [Bacteroides clarus]MBD9144291.1 glycosyltransferase family 2 protein [Bacteroides clarus]RGV37698.1 glycosyltransferase family 2 protein [Bacteroides clarus]RGV50361.1 glycosyltransferase family 2 protein [Bacteroides clarus]